MVPHRLTRWFLVSLVALIAFPAQLLALEATPASGETQLYIGHSARLTARIPAGWSTLPLDLVEFGHIGYGNGEGMFASTIQPQPTLAEACEASASEAAGDTAFTIRETTFKDAPACEIGLPSSIFDGLPLTIMVITHPEPFELFGMAIAYVAILSTTEHYEAILPTISFDLSGLTGPDIAHSILDVVEASSFFSDELDWGRLHEAADRLDSPNDVNRFLTNRILRALRSAGDYHSFLMPPIPAGGGQGMFPGPPSGEMRGDLGYIEIPSGALPSDWDDYVDAGLGTLAELESQACGWIIDLRSNEGGSVPLMLQSLLPLMPEGPLVGFVDRHGEESWVRREGDQLVMETEGKVVHPFDIPLPTLQNPDAPIAVLVGPLTASAAEYTLLSLIHRPNTRSFGLPTGGYTTGNLNLGLLDGSVLALAGAAALDTHGNTYTGTIQPDERVTYQAPGGDAQGMDDTIVAAEQWLLEQPACQQSATPLASPAP